MCSVKLKMTFTLKKYYYYFTFYFILCSAHVLELLWGRDRPEDFSVHFHNKNKLPKMSYFLFRFFSLSLSLQIKRKSDRHVWAQLCVFNSLLMMACMVTWVCLMKLWGKDTPTIVATVCGDRVELTCSKRNNPAGESKLSSVGTKIITARFTRPLEASLVHGFKLHM